IGRTASTDDLGEFRLFGVTPGQYYLQATWRAAHFNGPPADGDRTGYAPLYFPGTLELGQAQRITVGAGTEVTDITMTMRPIKTARISGIAVDSQGQPLRGMLMVMQSSPFMGISMGAPIRPDGTFTLNGLPPGDYMLRTQQQGPPGEAEVGTMPVTVGSENIEGLQIATAKPSMARG